MIRPTVRLLLFTLAGLTAGLAVAVAFAAWRLSAGPISLTFAVAAVEDLVNDQETPGRWTIGDIVLLWGGSGGSSAGDGVNVRLLDVRAVDRQGRTMVQIPELAVALSTAALARATLAPEALHAYRPTLHIRRGGTDGLAWPQSEEGKAGLAADILRDLTEVERSESRIRFLRRVEISDALLTYEDADRDLRWTAPTQQISVWRDGGTIKGELQLAVVAADDTADVVVVAEHEQVEGRATGPIDLAVTFAGLRPAAFADFAPAAASLRSVDLPLDGTLTAELDESGRIGDVVFEVSTTGGTVVLPAADGADDHAQRDGNRQVLLGPGRARGRYMGEHESLDLDLVDLTVRDDRYLRGGATPDAGAEVRVVVAGRVFAADSRVEIDDAVLDFGEDGSLLLPAPLNHRMPLRMVRLRGRYLGERDRLVIDALVADLRGPRAEATGSLSGLRSQVRVGATAWLTGLDVDHVGDYWPASLGSDARKWVLDHLAGGTMTDAVVRISARIEGSDLTINDLSGSFALNGVAVTYMPEMPAVSDASGTAAFDEQTFTITVAHGSSEGAQVESGTIRFAGLDGHEETVDIDLDLQGPLTAALRLIDSPPLSYASDLGVDPSAVAGTATVDLELDFPLIKTLAPDDLNIAAHAEATDVVVRRALLGEDVRSPRLTFEIDKKGLDVSGAAQLGRVSGHVQGRESFAGSDDRHIVVTVPDVHLEDLQALVWDDPAAMADVPADGSISATVQIEGSRHGGNRLAAELDLSGLHVAMPYGLWEKERGEAASAELSGHFDQHGLADLTVSGVSEGVQRLSFAGSASFATEGGLRRIAVESLVTGRTDAGGELTPLSGGGWQLAVRGRSLDLKPALQDIVANDEPAEEGGSDPVRLTFDLDSLWLTQEYRLTGLTAALERNHDVWTVASAQARADDGSRIDGSVTGADVGTGTGRTLVVTAENAGAAFRSLGLFNSMVGGRLTMQADLGGGVGASALQGRLRVDDYHIKNAPTVAKLLSMMAVTGIDDVLRGDGLAFSVLDVPFAFEGGRLAIEEARASGPSLGFTASGSIDFPDDRMNVQGTVVPLYLINGTLGRIPLLGPLLSGGEKGGGLFAATYTMTGAIDDPVVSVNPLAALAPSYLRELFEGSGGNSDGYRYPTATPPSVQEGRRLPAR